MTRAQVHVDRLADFTVQLLETIKPFRPYAKKIPKLPHDDACEIHTDLVEALKVLNWIEQNLWDQIKDKL
jgi:hypothetical protein